MDETFDRVLKILRTLEGSRHKLILIVGGFASGKTRLLKRLEEETEGVYLNLNLELSDRLLALPPRRYRDGVTVHKEIDVLCDARSPGREPLFVDNVELLFSPELGRINPVDTFKRMARQRPVVLALPGRRREGLVEYSEVGREDYMPMPVEEYPIVELS
jgi:hypothetical protein